MTLDATLSKVSAHDQASPGTSDSRLDGHIAASVSILVTSAAIAVYAARSGGLPVEAAAGAGAGFATAAVLLHGAIARLGRARAAVSIRARPATRVRRSTARAAALPAMAGSRHLGPGEHIQPGDRIEPLLPPRGESPAGPASAHPGTHTTPAVRDRQRDLPRGAAPDATHPTASATTNGLRRQPGLAELQAPVRTNVPADPSLSGLALSGPPPLPTTLAIDPPVVQSHISLIDEDEVQRIERLVKQLAHNVRQIEASAAAQAVRTGLQRPPRGPVVEDHALPPRFVQVHDHVIGANCDLLPTQTGQHMAASPLVPPPLPNAMPTTLAAGGVDGEPDRATMQIAAALSSTDLSPAETATARAGDAPPNWYPDTERDAILAALNAQRIDVYLEPILDIREQRPQHYEVSIGLRTADGDLIDLAKTEVRLSGTGLLPLLDQTRIVQAAGLAERLAARGKTGSVVTDVHGETLSDDGFQANFTAAERRVGAFPGHLVLALPQADVAHFATADWQTLARLQVAGFGFALTGIATLDMDFEALARRGFVIARLDAETFLHGLPAEGAVVAPADICRHLAGCGLSLVVGGIVDDQQLARIFGFGVLFGQGQVFGGPRPVEGAVRQRAVMPDGARPSLG